MVRRGLGLKRGGEQDGDPVVIKLAQATDVATLSLVGQLKAHAKFRSFLFEGRASS